MEILITTSTTDALHQPVILIIIIVIVAVLLILVMCVYILLLHRYFHPLLYCLVNNSLVFMVNFLKQGADEMLGIHHSVFCLSVSRISQKLLKDFYELGMFIFVILVKGTVD